MRVTDIPQINQLSIPEKILFLEDLWDSIESCGSEILVPDSHKKLLDRRLNSPGELLSLEQLRTRIEKQT